MSHRHWLAIGIATVALAAGPPVAGQGGNAGGQASTTDPTALVWPGPPEQPRIRFVAAISGAEDVRGKVRLSFIERLAGRAPQRQWRLEKPYGVAVDSAGRIYVADSARRAVVIFDRDAKSVGEWRGSGQFPLSLPVGLAFDGSGRLFVSDSFRAYVVVFTPRGEPVAALGQGTIGRPGGLAVDRARKRLYVADAKLNLVHVFDTETFALQQTIGTKVTGRPTEFPGGVFVGPTNVAVDARGEVYVTDTFNCRIQVFDATGQFLRSIGSQGLRPGYFIRPKGLALDSEGHLYVVDAAFNNFQVLTAEGNPLMFVGAAGNEAGQFMLPAGMAIDSEDRIYVTEQRMDGGRLQIFQYLRESAAPKAGGGAGR